MKNIIGKRLIALRREKTQQEVADAVGVSLTALKDYEQGERIPRDEIKQRFAEYFRKTVKDIFFICPNHITCPIFSKTGLTCCRRTK